MDADINQAGGFMPSSILPSPSPSDTSSRIGAASQLPHPRPVALHPGSNKEETVRRYVEDKLLNISRRYVKKFGQPNPLDTVSGFTSFSEVCSELDGVVNILWLSGTPSLQIPFLLKLASDFTQYVRSFPPSPRATFSLLRKLDHCFSSLLIGQDMKSRESLPGFENGLRSGMTTTDMVRCRSLVEQSRVLMVEIMSQARGDDDERTDDETGTEQDETEMERIWNVYDEEMHLDAARVYENTIVALGERIGDGALHGAGSS